MQAPKQKEFCHLGGGRGADVAFGLLLLNKYTKLALTCLEASLSKLG